jgi:hypothetical protein
MKKWFWENREKIGYTIGALNIANGLVNLFLGDILNGLLWTAIGAFIVYDVRTYK